MFKVKFRFTIDGENEKGLVTVFVNREQYTKNEHEMKAIDTIREKYWSHPDFNENNVTVDEYETQMI
jgi:hypothetical protein